MGKKAKGIGHVRDEDSDTVTLRGDDSLGGTRSTGATLPPLAEENRNIEVVTSIGESPSSYCDETTVRENKSSTKKARARETPMESSEPREATDLTECADVVDEDDYNFRIKFKIEMTWHLVYFLLWNFLARHAWNIWIEFVSVVLVYSAVGLFGSLSPTRYPASWCLWAVKCYLWLNPIIQVYNGLWFARLFFMDNVFWFTYITMLLNCGVLYCGHVSASEYFENDLSIFMERYFPTEEEHPPPPQSQSP
ncbi:Aste57867_8389 [Aphanomyces stellatus]|uniref:Aste57867_8389 protein n=1 Tax=Aphanomyces stellatus TaxID=120398 RepID=A0A485KK62_9STRA|nr:hypothetical protein As57867_008357 [Aphanomyces stellatus]VFT85275.1 Aste57867_8389 [Aphanomyces stellatus]